VDRTLEILLQTSRASGGYEVSPGRRPTRDLLLSFSAACEGVLHSSSLVMKKAGVILRLFSSLDEG